MKLIPPILLFVFLSSRILCVGAEDAPMLPRSLNVLLTRITPGMAKEDVRKLLVSAYPKLVEHPGFWSGPNGRIGFCLDENFKILIDACFDSQRREVVAPDPRIVMFDGDRKLIVTIEHESSGGRK